MMFRAAMLWVFQLQRPRFLSCTFAPLVAAGELSVAFWDHWMPEANKIMQQQVEVWAATNKVRVQTDFIPSNGSKLLMTGLAEAQTRIGHDVMTFFNWDIYHAADSLAPVDDVMQRLTAKYGAVSSSAEYLARAKGAWLAVPTNLVLAILLDGHGDAGT
jgi:hypothetical protein